MVVQAFCRHPIGSMIFQLTMILLSLGQVWSLFFCGGGGYFILGPANHLPNDGTREGGVDGGLRVAK